MSIDASIILGLKPPENPIDSFAKVAQYRNLIQQGQSQQQAQELGRQKIQEGQIALQEAQRKQASQEAVRQGFLKGNGDPVKTREFAIQAGAGAEEITNLDKHLVGIAKDKAEIDSKQLSIDIAKNSQLLQLHDQAMQLAQNNPQAYMQAWPQIAERAKALDPKAADHIDPNTPWTPQQLATSKALHMTQDYFLKSEAEKRATTEEARKAALAVPQLAEAENRAVTTKPNAVGLIPEQVQTAAQAAATAAETARHNAAEEVAARQRLGIESAAQGIKAKEFEATFGAGANPALQGVEPKLRVPAMKEASKAADEFATATKAADSMQSMIDLARAGNKAAGSNLPLVGVETLNALNGIKRINKTEVDQYQGAGSLLDRIQGKIGKLAVGQPIPADVMKDIEDMHQKLRGDSAKAYNNKLSGINQNYRSNFQPVKAATAQPAGGGTIRVKRKSDGVSGTIDPKDYDPAKYDKIQ